MTDVKLVIEPDTDEPEAASVYVDGTINGREYRFLLDTGAARSGVINDDYTATLSTVGSHQSSGAFGSGSEDLVTVDHLALGPISKRDMTLTRSVPGPGTQTLIGMDVLRGAVCHFLFDEHRLSFPAVINLTQIMEPLWVDAKYHPYLRVDYGGMSASAVWDTGASLTVVDRAFLDRSAAYFTPAGQSTGTDARGTQVETPMFIMSAATMGGYVFPPHRVAVVDLAPVNASLERPMDLILGYSTYRWANWLFDFPRQQWTITRWHAGQNSRTVSSRGDDRKS